MALLIVSVLHTHAIAWNSDVALRARGGGGGGEGRKEVRQR